MLVVLLLPFISLVFIYIYISLCKGYQLAYETYGDHYSYDNNTRALMFRRDFPTISTIEDMSHEMRQNNYKTDVYALNNPGRWLVMLWLSVVSF